MKKKITIFYDPVTGETECTIFYDNQIFEGTAACHPADYSDFCSERTGCQIAECRANLQALRYRKKQLKFKIDVLESLYKDIKNSSKHTYNFEFKILQKHIKNMKKELAEVKEDIQQEKSFLNSYIDQKEKFYQTVRDSRRAKEIN